MELSNIQALIQPELNDVTQLINEHSLSTISSIKQIITPFVTNPGKMIRPTISILAANLAGNYSHKHKILATAIELLHLATLLHDDVIDNAKFRRNTSSINQQWGNKATILVGDFLLAKAAQLISSLNNTEIFKLFTTATTIIAEGEMLQLANNHNLTIKETTYFNIISQKTAKLFEITALAAANLTNCSIAIKTNLASYGLHFGLAFQLLNDLMDYYPAKQQTNFIANDLQNGIITLPIIYIVKNGTAAEQQLLEDIMTQQNQELLAKLQTIIASSGAIAYTKELAQQELNLAKQALEHFVSTPYKIAAIELLEAVTNKLNNIGV